MTPAAIAPAPFASAPRDRLTAVLSSICAAARDARRNVDDVTLIAVSKTQPAAAIQALIDAGQRVFGENRVQEAEAKWPALLAANPPLAQAPSLATGDASKGALGEGEKPLALHMVGQLQSNKAEAAVRLFDAIHSLDRPALVTALARAMDRLDRRVPCFIQVNLSGEAQKGGCQVAAIPALLAAAHDADVPVVGLMTVPPVGLEPAPWFALLAKLADDHGLSGLSMGMTADYASAVRIGATHVRVGTGLFGSR